jgi:hypothetical protein
LKNAQVLLTVICILLLIGYIFIRLNNIKSVNNTEFSIVETQKDSINLGKISFYTRKHTSFEIKNKGTNPFIIYTVNTTCGCTAAKFDKKPVLQGETTTVILEYKPNSLGFFTKTADVVCNVPEGYVRLKISGEVVEK